MPRAANELSDLQVRRLLQPGHHAVGGVAGLMLRVKPSGARSWILRVRIGGKRRDIGLGGYPTVTLKQARDRARRERELIYAGRDPIAERQARRDALRIAEASRLTFSKAAVRAFDARKAEFRSEKHSRQWLSSIERFAFPVVGELPVADVSRAHILEILNPIWSTRTETATRLRQRIETVLRWATVAGYRTGPNPAAWKDNLAELLPKPSKITKILHYPALPWQQMGEFMSDLRARSGMGAKALEFAILTAARSGEVRGATWPEIDLSSRTWTIPGNRMKGGREHTVPLSEPAVTLLKQLPRAQNSGLVFPAPRGGILSDMTLSKVTRSMHEAKLKAGGSGYVDKNMNRPVVPHGFRSTFKDWARNSTNYPDEVTELALAHVNSDATRAAYARDELMVPRAHLMSDWAQYCDQGHRAGTIKSTLP